MKDKGSRIRIVNREDYRKKKKKKKMKLSLCRYKNIVESIKLIRVLGTTSCSTTWSSSSHRHIFIQSHINDNQTHAKTYRHTNKYKHTLTHTHTYSLRGYKVKEKDVGTRVGVRVMDMGSRVGVRVKDIRASK